MSSKEDSLQIIEHVKFGKKDKYDFDTKHFNSKRQENSEQTKFESA